MVWCDVGALGVRGIPTEELARKISRIIIDQSVLMGIIKETLFQSERNLMTGSKQTPLIWEYAWDAIQGLLIFAIFAGIAITCDFIASELVSLGVMVRIVGWIVAVCGMICAICFEFSLTFKFIRRLWEDLGGNEPPDQKGGDK